jgi:antirestriction protein ArdC/phage/plasmid primase-like uncharacterized protein
MTTIIADKFTAKLVENLIDQLKTGTAPWQRPQEPSFVLPYNPVTSEVFSAGNLITLMTVAKELGYSDPRWFTYKGAQEANGQVRGNQKGTPIKIWAATREVEVNKDGTPILGKDGEPVMRTKPYLTTAYVFNAAQIENLPELEKVEVPFDAQKRAEKILQLSGARINNKPGSPHYLPKIDCIVLPPRDTFEDLKHYYSAAFRELGHWTGHETRFNRDINHPVGSDMAAREELRAEIFSMMICAELGLPYEPLNHTGYSNSWVRIAQEDYREIYRAAADAEKIYGYVIGLERSQKIEFPENQQSRHQAAFVQPKINPVVTLTKDDEIRLAANSDKVIDVQAENIPVNGPGEASGRGDSESARALHKGYTIDPVKKQELQSSLKGQFISRSEKERQSFDIAAKRAEKQLVTAEQVQEKAWHEVFERIQISPVPKTAIDEAGNLLVPVYDVHGNLKSCQSISPQGVKTFTPGSHVEGGIFIVGGGTDKLRTQELVLVASSFENAAVVNHATGNAVVVAFTDANLIPAAQAIRTVNPNATILICTERRYQAQHESDPGVAKAIEAASAVKGSVISPITPNARNFVEVGAKLGKDAVRHQVETSLKQKLQKVEPKVKEPQKVQERARAGMSR